MQSSIVFRYLYLTRRVAISYHHFDLNHLWHLFAWYLPIRWLGIRTSIGLFRLRSCQHDHQMIGCFGGFGSFRPTCSELFWCIYLKLFFRILQNILKLAMFENTYLLFKVSSRILVMMIASFAPLTYCHFMVINIPLKYITFLLMFLRFEFI